MAAEGIGDAFVEIGANLNPFDSAMGKVKNTFAGTVSGLEAGAVGLARSMGGWLAGAFTFTGFLKEAITQEQATMDLAIAIKSAGMNVDEMLPKLSNFASKLTETTTYEDELLKSAMASGLQIGIQADQIERATKAAIGLAARYNLDLNSAMMGISRLAAGGSARWMQYYGIVDSTKTKTEQLNEAMRVGENAFMVAELKAQTLGGAIKITGRNFMEAGGRFMGLASDALGTKDALAQLSSGLREVGTAMEGVKENPLARTGLRAFGMMMSEGFKQYFGGGVPSAERLKQLWGELVTLYEKGEDIGKKVAGLDAQKKRDLDDELSKRGMVFSSIEDAWKKQQEIANKTSGEKAAAVVTTDKAVEASESKTIELTEKTKRKLAGERKYDPMLDAPSLTAPRIEAPRPYLRAFEKGIPVGGGDIKMPAGYKPVFDNPDILTALQQIAANTSPTNQKPNPVVR